MNLSPEQLAAIEEQKQHCPFCKIIRREIPVNEVFEDEDYLAILDINPGVPGHILLIPKEHYPIMPLMPEPIQKKMARYIADLSAALKKAVVVPDVETFIANGAAAGQQSSHFLIHLLPTETPQFTIEHGETELSKKLRAVLSRKKTPNKEMLSKVISENPQLKRMIIDQPQELIKNLDAAPDLKKMFEGVDIMALSKKLKEQEEPRAVNMDDKTLVTFINEKQKLMELLINDPTTLAQAIEDQPKLKTFFSGTTVGAVRERYLRGNTNV